jgi:hypothetical protein
MGFFVHILDYVRQETIVVREVGVRFGTFERAIDCAEVMYAARGIVPFGIRVVDCTKATLWERNVTNDYLYGAKGSHRKQT